MDARLARHLELASLSDDAFVELAYSLVLRRDADTDERRGGARRLREGTLSRAALLQELVGTDEFARLRALDDAVAAAMRARRVRERPRGLRPPFVEIAWVLARYRGEPRVLVLGYARADPGYLVALTQLGARELVGVDAEEAEVPGLRGVVADLADLPFDDASFDLVVAAGDEDVVGGLHELRRVLAGAGRLLVTLPHRDEWEQAVDDAGFAVFEHEEYPELAFLCAELRPRRRFDRLLRRLGR